jgi:hypothetical protein
MLVNIISMEETALFDTLAYNAERERRNRAIAKQIKAEPILRNLIRENHKDEPKFFYVGEFNDFDNYSACVAYTRRRVKQGKKYVFEYECGVSFISPDDKKLGAPKAASRYRALRRLLNGEGALSEITRPTHNPDVFANLISPCYDNSSPAVKHIHELVVDKFMDMMAHDVVHELYETSK